MKKLLLLLLVVTSVQAEGLYITTGLGKNFFNEEPEDGVAAHFSLYYTLHKQSWCANCMPTITYTHLSQWNKGKPFNEETEKFADYIGFNLTWKLLSK